jgi:hypothetical protein
MTEAISSLYAEIGFKVDDTGLKEFNAQMVELKDTIDEISSKLKGLPELKSFPQLRVIQELKETQELNIPKTDSLSQLKINEGKLQIARDRENRLRETFEERKKRNAQRDEERKERQKKREAAEQERKRKRERAEAERKKRATNRAFLKGLTTVMTGVSAFMTKTLGLTYERSTSAKTYRDFTAFTGDTAAALQKWEALSAVTGAGMSREAIAGALESVRQGYNELVKGNESFAQSLKFLGIQHSGSPDELMEQMRARWRTLESDEQRRQFLSFASDFGFSPGSLARMFSATSEQLKEAREMQSRMLSPDGIKALDDFYTDIGNINKELENLEDRMSKAFADTTKKSREETKETLRSEFAQAIFDAFGVAGGILWGAAADVGTGVLKAAFLPGAWAGEGLAYLNKPVGGYPVGSQKVFYDNREFTINANSEEMGARLANDINPSFSDVVTNAALGSLIE